MGSEVEQDQLPLPCQSRNPGRETLACRPPPSDPPSMEQFNFLQLAVPELCYSPRQLAAQRPAQSACRAADTPALRLRHDDQLRASLLQLAMPQGLKELEGA